MVGTFTGMLNHGEAKAKGLCAMLPKNMRFRSFIKAVDKFFSKFLSLAYRSVVVCRKKGT